MRNIKILPILFSVAFLGIALASQFISTAKVYAVGEQYVFAYPTEDEKVDYLSGVFKDKSTGDAALNGTRVYGKNGVWGDGLSLLYDKKATDDYNTTGSVCGKAGCSTGKKTGQNKRFVYSQNYNCSLSGRATPDSLVEGYSIQIQAIVDLGPNFTKNGHDYKTVTGSVTKRENGKTTKIDKGDMPASCRLPDASGRMDNYNNLSATEKASWNKSAESKSLNDTFNLGVSDENEDPQADCDAKLSSTLSWILCPVIDLGVNMTDYVFENFISPFLDNVPISTNPKDGAYKAWQQFRILANVLLIGTLLAIVYAQIRGDR